MNCIAEHRCGSPCPWFIVKLDPIIEFPQDLGGEDGPPAPAPPGKRGRRKRRRGHSPALRLRDNREGVLRFTRDPATNNEAERAMRPLKVQQKISGSFRSAEGARNQAA